MAEHPTPETAEIPAAARVRVLLYGDVDLNVMDGSAIWLPSMAETLTRAGAEVHVQLKAEERRDLLTAPLRALDGVTVLEARPRAGQNSMEPARAATVLAEADERERYDVVLVRGIHMCSELAERHAFPGRLWSYVTEFGYVAGEFSSSRQETIGAIAAASRLMLAQTPQARAVLEAMVPAAAGRTEILSPMVPDEVRPVERSAEHAAGPLRMIYTGKFAHDWHTDKMPAILEHLTEAGVEARLTMVGDKVHREPKRSGWASRMRTLLNADMPGFEWTGALSRVESMDRMAHSDVSLGWRAPRLDLSLEISTKVLESCALGVPPLVNRTTIHEELLGTDYPLFIDALRDDAEAIARRLQGVQERLPELSAHVLAAAEPYRMTARAEALRGYFARLGLLDQAPAAATLSADAGQHASPQAGESGAAQSADAQNAEAVSVSPRRTRVVVAGHDLKFAGELVDMLRDDPSVELRLDHWSTLHKHDESASTKLIDWADVVVCEWAGPNAVWYSKHKRPGQRLVVRLHMFELRGGWLENIDTDAVDALVTVSGLYRDLTREHMAIDPAKVTVIPNAVSVADLDRPGLPDRRYRLGLVGIVPLRKRLDRAVDLLEALRRHDDRFTLHIRGRMPWEYAHEWRKPLQREGYLDLFARIGGSDLREVVAFEPFGADMGTWLTKIGWVLSPSTTESFHLAPAEGMVSGAVPLVWQRPGAVGVFGEDFVVPDTEAAAERVLAAVADDEQYGRLSDLSRQRVQGYDERAVAALWHAALFPAAAS
ncbi:glycosyltransferase [uncultured Micrococcus sp.]|uniref:glycosyltransferase n=1 Tax=uncultured Micrococcus sp. TaxID=114051 RepID=UPI002592A19B|nr:glycosyltransferase [uncultured Micrococcus sp.]